MKVLGKQDAPKHRRGPRRGSLSRSHRAVHWLVRLLSKHFSVPGIVLGPGNTVSNAHILVWEDRHMIKVCTGHGICSDVRITFQVCFGLRNTFE